MIEGMWTDHVVCVAGDFEHLGAPPIDGRDTGCDQAGIAAVVYSVETACVETIEDLSL